MAKRHTPDNFAQPFEEIKKAPARAAILVSGAIVEYALTELVQEHLRQPTTAEERKFFVGEGEILSTFSEKIWAAYFLRLIGPKTRRDLDLVRLIRNECAHNMNPLTFSSPSIAQRCKELHLGKDLRAAKRRPPNYRRMFTVTAQILASGLILRSVVENLTPPPDDPIATWIDD